MEHSWGMTMNWLWDPLISRGCWLLTCAALGPRGLGQPEELHLEPRAGVQYLQLLHGALCAGACVLFGHSHPSPFQNGECLGEDVMSSHITGGPQGAVFIVSACQNFARPPWRQNPWAAGRSGDLGLEVLGGCAGHHHAHWVHSSHVTFLSAATLKAAVFVAFEQAVAVRLAVLSADSLGPHGPGAGSLVPAEHGARGRVGPTAVRLVAGQPGRQQERQEKEQQENQQE